jgi:hypothetical protein
MAFHEIAYTPDEHLLLTLDGVELLAYDAQTEGPKWRLTFAHRLVAALFVDAGVLPASQGSNPWRSSAGRYVVAVDAEGGVHTIDPTLGQETGTLGPFGKPAGVATGAGGVFALATEERLYLWRSGERTEIPSRATTALAFSNDGATLALGAADGSLRFLSATASTPPVETFCAVVHGGVTDLVQHPGGTWVACGKTGVSTVTASGPQRVERLPAGVMRVRIDGNGKRLAAQLSDRVVAVYAWPSLEVELRVEYVERVVRGLSFGPSDWLGLALDHGDGNKIDILTSATHRTDTHPGRTHRSWLLSVRGKETVLSAKEAEDIRRMKEPFHTPAPTKSSGTGGKVGIGVGLSVAVLCLRLCAVAGRSSSSYTPPAYNPYLNPLTTPASATCDRACATQRLVFLQAQCRLKPCASKADEAASAYASGNCRRAKAALAGIATASSADTDDVLATLALSRADSGLTEACASDTSRFAASKHTSLVRLEGPTLRATTESVPEPSSLEAEEPAAIWTAPDGSVFVTTKFVSGGRKMSHVHRRDKTGVWEVVTRRRSTIPAQVWIRSATDVYVMDVDSLVHWNGTKTTDITAPAPRLLALGGIGEDMLVASEPSPDDGSADAAAPVQLHRRRGVSGPWTDEPAVPGLVVKELWSAGGTVWGRAVAGDGEDGIDDQLVKRDSGRWTEKKWFGATRPTTAAIGAVWVSPTGDAFVSTNTGVFRSVNGGASWAKTGTPEDVESLWGRSNSDVYAATGNGLMHYDGKAWSKTSYTDRATAIAGTATAVLLLVATD